MTSKAQIIEHVQTLASHQVKELVLEWLAGTETNLDEFERLLDTDYPSDLDSDYGELNHEGNFQPLTESQMGAKSLDVLESYQRTRDGIPHEQVQEWLDGIASGNSRSCL
jgi:hypothetical protein